MGLILLWLLGIPIPILSAGAAPSLTFGTANSSIRPRGGNPARPPMTAFAAARITSPSCLVALLLFFLVAGSVDMRAAIPFNGSA